MMNDNESVYLRLYKWAYGSKRITCALRSLDVACVALTVVAYIATVVAVGINAGSLLAPVGLVLTTGVPFVVLSVMRKVINMPRPREVLGQDFLPGKRGRSFPSRHVFSSFSIGTALCFVCVPAGVIVLAMGALIAACRVALGNHFLRDVIAGALMGACCSIIGMLIL